MNLLKKTLLTASFVMAALGDIQPATAAIVPSGGAAAAAAASAAAARARRAREFKAMVANPSVTASQIIEKMSDNDQSFFDARDMPYFEAARRDVFAKTTERSTESVGLQIMELMHERNIRDVIQRVIATVSDTAKTADQIKATLNGYTIDLAIDKKEFSFGPSSADYVAEARREIMAGKLHTPTSRYETFQIMQKASEKDSAHTLKVMGIIGGVAVLGFAGIGVIDRLRRNSF